MFYLLYTLLTLLFFYFSFYKSLIKKKKNKKKKKKKKKKSVGGGGVFPKLRQEVKVKVDIITSDDIKIYHTGKFQDFTARYIINVFIIPKRFIHGGHQEWPNFAVINVPIIMDNYEKLPLLHSLSAT